MARILAWSALALVLVALIAAATLLLWARSTSGRRVILARVVALAQRELDGRLTVGALEGNLTREIRLRRVRLYDREHRLALAADDVRVDYSLVGLLRRHVRVRSLAVSGARAYVRRLGDGRLNVATLRRAAPSEPSAGERVPRGWDLTVEALRVHAEIIAADAAAPPLRGRVSVTGTLAWRDDAPSFDVDARLDLPAGDRALRAEARATKRPAGPIAWQATIDAHDLDPAALVAGAPHGRLALSARAHGSDGSGAIDVDTLALDAAGTHASLRGSLALGATLTADLRGELHSPELARVAGFALPGLHGRVDAHAHLVRTSSHTYVDAAATARSVRYRALHLASLDGHVHVADGAGRVVLHARGAGPSGLRAELEAHGARLPGEGAGGLEGTIDRVHLGTREQAWQLTAPGRVRVDRRAITAALALASAGQTLTLDGALERGRRRALTATLRGHAFELARLRPLLPPSLRALSGAADLTVTLSGAPRAAALTAHGEARLGTAGSGGVLDGDLSATVDTARAWRDPLRALVRTRPLSLRVRGHALDLAQLPLDALRDGAVQPGRLDLSLDAHGTLRDATAALHATARGIHVAAVDGIEVVADGRYEHGRARLTLSGTVAGQPAVAATAQSRFALDELLDGRDLPVDAEVTLPAFDLSRAGPLSGIVEGQAAVRGTLAHPIARAELHGRDLRGSELRLSTLAARAGWDGRALTATVDAAQPSGGTLHLDASLPADADAAARATLRADAFGFAVEDVGRVHRLEGVLAGDLVLAGSRHRPTLAGSLRLDHGAFAGGRDPRLFHDLALELAAHDHTVELQRLSVRVGRGGLTAHGHLTLAGLAPAELELTADAERFPFDATNAQAWVDARIHLHARRVGDTLQGKLTVTDGHATLPALAGRRKLQPTGPLEDVVYVDEPEPARRALTPPPFRVIAHIPGPFHVDSPELHAQLRGELEARSRDGTLALYGHAETTAGRVEILGREYEIEHARVSFDGDPDPALDVRVTRVLADATLVITLHGTARDPKLELASEPPLYNPSQILGIIVAGDPDTPHLDETATERRVVGAIGNVLAGKLQGQLLRGLPLDVLQIEPVSGAGALGNARVEAGKFVRKNLYVSYVYHFGATMHDLHRTNTHEARFEYRPRRHLVVGVHYGDAGIGAIDVSFTFRY
ncbi:MAG TPA: translocation/assembly module TamB domain-containing protein [Polyangia bacterium]|nr:translocation/assembly module TamB domain-containing protein [Polyangia bacterium]